MHLDTCVAEEIVAKGRLRIFSLYVDFAAAGRARWATAQIARLAGPGGEPAAEMWNLGSVTTSGSLKKIIAHEAVNADVLIAAMSYLDHREPAVIQWLDSLTRFQAARPARGLLVGLFGDKNNQAGELEWTVKEFARSARQLNRDFIWCWMVEEAMGDSRWLTDNVGKLPARGPSVAHAAGQPVPVPILAGPLAGHPGARLTAG